MSVDVLMPRLSDSMEEGVISLWLCATGDSVVAGQEIAEIETDKATVRLQAEADGVLRCLVAEGDSVAVGAPFARIGTAEEASAPEDEPVAPSLNQARGRTAAAGESPAGEPASRPLQARRVLITPVARRLALEAGLANLSELGRGSGPQGRIHKTDVERFLAARATAPAERSRNGALIVCQDEVLEPTRVQALIARRMVAAKLEIPHYYVSTSVAIDAAEELRRSVAESARARPSMTDLIVLACARALRTVPEVNASWVDGKIIRRGGVHIGLAVALDDGGLVVPVLRDADDLSLVELAEQRAALVDRARAGKLAPADMEGGTFSVSNLGMFGVDDFQAIVNPPESGILAVGSVDERVSLNDGELSTRRIMRISLSADHRVYSGATAARFVADVRSGLECPLMLLADRLSRLVRHG